MQGVQEVTADAEWDGDDVLGPKNSLCSDADPAAFAEIYVVGLSTHGSGGQL